MFIQVVGVDFCKCDFHLVVHDRKGNSLFRKKLSRKSVSNFYRIQHQRPPLSKPVVARIGWDDCV